MKESTLRYRNITDRKNQLDWLQSDKLNCMVFAAKLMNLDQQATEIGTYFSERFKL